MKRVVVTGMGAVSPNGIGREAFWNATATGVSGTDRVTLFDDESVPCKVAAEVKDMSFMDKLTFLTEKDKSRIQRAIPMALYATMEAAAQAGISLQDLSDSERREIGVIVGSGGGGIEFGERQYRIWFEQGLKRVSPYAIVASFVGMVSSEINMAFRLYGMSHVVSTGCTSSSDALGYAFNTIRMGQIPMLITGGIEACITRGLMLGFCKMGTVSMHRNETPKSASRPFNADRDGFIFGEGAWMFILEEMEHAQRRGATILAEIVGYGSTCDAYHRVQIAPTGEESARAMDIALKDARMGPDEIDYINMHGTATKINDKIESHAVRLVFGKRADQIPASSTKSMIGHPQGAAGAAGLSATILAMRNNFAPPTINFETPDPDCDLDYVPNVGRESRIDAALVNCIAFGSKNSVLIVRRPQ
ncbi:MAG TPA: beta-ketoacyl-[acyl-carrier-protein] synthase family protein [Blastocatellia bacterium]|nr:beta-ketoacyl-[acyl-carrier-protein] synthase family protein [Blastocatellia bacterium]